jgi:hypothetical protein
VVIGPVSAMDVPAVPAEAPAANNAAAMTLTVSRFNRSVDTVFVKHFLTFGNIVITSP